MKKFRFLLALLGLACCLCLTLATHAANRPVTQRGPSLLHLDSRSVIDRSEFETNLVGSMKLQFHQKGDVRKQSLQISASGLETNAPMGLTAAINDDSNVTTILSRTSDNRGRVAFSFQSQDPARGRLGKGREPLPEVLSPLSNVRAFCIEDSNLQVIGFAWVQDSTSFRYIVQRNLTASQGASAEGSIKLVATQRKVNFSLLAGGLIPEAPYSLALNGTSVLSTTADQTGRLQIRRWPTNAPPVLEVRSLALVDNNNTAVLSTSLPE